jgi:hypothetical protein
MEPNDLALFRQQLDEQFRAAVQLLYEGCCARLRAAEAAYLAQGRLDPASLPPFTFGAPGLPLPELPLPPRAALPEPAAPALPPAPQVAPPQASAPRVEKQKRRRWGPNELRDDVLAALDRVGEEFDRTDLVRALGYEPRRSTLHGLLTDLADREGLLAVVKHGTGRKPSRYRKLRGCE